MPIVTEGHATFHIEVNKDYDDGELLNELLQFNPCYIYVLFNKLYLSMLILRPIF